MPKTTKKLHWTQRPENKAKLKKIRDAAVRVQRARKAQEEFNKHVASGEGQAQVKNAPAGYMPMNYAKEVTISKDDVIKELQKRCIEFNQSYVERATVLEKLDEVFRALSGLFRSLK